MVRIDLGYTDMKIESLNEIFKNEYSIELPSEDDYNSMHLPFVFFENFYCKQVKRTIAFTNAFNDAKEINAYIEKSKIMTTTTPKPNVKYYHIIYN